MRRHFGNIRSKLSLFTKLSLATVTVSNVTTQDWNLYVILRRILIMLIARNTINSTYDTAEFRVFFFSSWKQIHPTIPSSTS
jgi:hypothetical protein